MNIDERHIKALDTEKRALLVYKKAKLYRLRLESFQLDNPDVEDIEIVDGVVRKRVNR